MSFTSREIIKTIKDEHVVVDVAYGEVDFEETTYFPACTRFNFSFEFRETEESSAEIGRKRPLEFEWFPNADTLIEFRDLLNDIIDARAEWAKKGQ